MYHLLMSSVDSRVHHYEQFLCKQCNSFSSFLLYNCPEQLNTVVGAEGSRRGRGIYHNADKSHFKFMTTNHNSTLGDLSAFFDKLNLPLSSTITSNFLLPVNLHFPPSSTFSARNFVSYIEEREASLSTYKCQHLISCYNGYTIHTPAASPLRC